MAVVSNAERFKTLEKIFGGFLSRVLRDNNSADVKPHFAERVNQAQYVFFIGNTQVTANFVGFNVSCIDGNDNFHVVFKLLQHADFAVRMKARQHA